MPAIRPPIDRRGHSFVELMTAMVSSAMLLAGLAAVLMISRQIAYAPTASNARVNAAQDVNRLAEELRCAKWVTVRSANAIEFVIADRNADGAGERIRYEWIGDNLLRTVNGGTAIAVADNVEDFQLAYTLVPLTDRVTPIVDGAEVNLAGNVSVQGSFVRAVNSQNWLSQQINPLGFASIPAGVKTWNATRVEFYGKAQWQQQRHAQHATAEQRRSKQWPDQRGAG